MLGADKQPFVLGVFLDHTSGGEKGVVPHWLDGLSISLWHGKFEKVDDLGCSHGVPMDWKPPKLLVPRSAIHRWESHLKKSES